MAEICFECFNKMENNKYKKHHVILDYDFCECCGEWKECVIVIKRNPYKIFLWWL